MAAAAGGPLELVAEWPAQGIAETRVVLDGGALRAVAARELDTQGWHSAHPGGTVHACYDGVCDRADGTTNSFEIDLPQADADGRKHDLAVTMADAAGTEVTSASVALVRVPGRSGGPVPVPRPVEPIGAGPPDGRLQLGGADDGRIIFSTL